MDGQQNWLGTLISLAVVALVLAFRWRSMRKQRRLRLATLWIVPVIFTGLVGIVVVATPPPAAGWSLLAIGLLVGAALGWQRGKAMRIEVDPATGRLMQSASPAAVLLLLVLVAVRSGFRAAQAEGVGLAIDPALATDALLGFGLGLIVATRVEMFVRARRLLQGR